MAALEFTHNYGITSNRAMWDGNNPYQQDGIIEHQRAGYMDGNGVVRDLGFFIVLDGHGVNGENVRDLVANNFLPTFANLFTQHTSLTNCLRDTIAQMDQDILNAGHNGGTTLTGVVLNYNAGTLYSINIGDSTTQIRVNGQVFLTRDHSPNDPVEEQYLTERGCFQEPDPKGGDGHYVIHPNNTRDVLGMSRSLGDHNHAFSHCLNKQPDIVKHQIQGQDVEVFIASDGYWDFLNHTRLPVQFRNMLANINTFNSTDYLQVIQRYFIPRRSRWDNTTILCVRMTYLPPL